MPIPSGRAYSAPGNGRELQALRDEVAQLRRRMTNPPKIPHPVAPSGGGIQGFTRCKPARATYFGTYWGFADWDFDRAWSNFGWKEPNTTPAIVRGIDINADDQTFHPAQAGWYFQRVRIISDCSDSRIIVRVNDAHSSGDIDPASYYHQTTLSARPDGGFYDVLWVGPFWLPAFDAAANSAAMRLNVQASGAASFWNVEVDVIAIG